MDKLKERHELRKFLEGKTTVPLRIAKGGAVIGGIVVGDTIVRQAIKLKNKIKKIKALKKKKKQKQTESVGSALSAVARRKKMLAKILGKTAISAAAWTAGGEIIAKSAKAAKAKADRDAKKRS